MYLDIFKKKLVKKTTYPNYHWLDKDLHPYLKEKLHKLISKEGISKKPTEEYNIVCIDYTLLKFLIAKSIIGSHYQYQYQSNKITNTALHVVQSISDLTKDEKELLKYSLQYKNPKEVLQISILTLSGNITLSPITVGTEFHVGDPRKMEEWIHYSISTLKRKGHSIQHIFIKHVHPSLEVIIDGPKGYQIITNGLGPSDLSIAKNISDHLSYPLTINAILPNQLKYSVIFDEKFL